MNEKYKVFVSYTDCRQTSPDTYDTYTKIIHLSEKDTFLEVMKKHFSGKSEEVNVELHIKKNTP